MPELCVIGTHLVYVMQAGTWAGSGCPDSSLWSCGGGGGSCSEPGSTVRL